MNKRTERRRIKMIDEERKQRIEQGLWVKDLANAFIQHYNLKKNDIGHFSKNNVLSELTILYTNFVDLNTGEFNQNTSNLKQSLINSVYAVKDMTLLRHYVKNLVKNDSSSFVLVPLSYRIAESNHLVTVIVKKKKEHFIVEIFDKSGQFPPEREKSAPKIDLPSHKRIVNHIYEVRDTKQNVEGLLYALENGRGERNVPLDSHGKKLGYKDYIPLRLISNLATKEYDGTKIGTSQIIGNCCIKSWTGALKSQLEQLRESQDKPSTESFNKILIEIACQQLAKAGYGTETINYFRELNELYNYNKLKRLEQDISSRQKNKIKVAHLLNNYFSQHEKNIKFTRKNDQPINVSLEKMNSSNKFSKLKRFFGVKEPNDSSIVNSLYSLSELDKQTILDNIGRISPEQVFEERMNSIKKEAKEINRKTKRVFQFVKSKEDQNISIV